MSGAFRGCVNLTIYAEAPYQPSGWHENWNPDNRPVVWGVVSDYDEEEMPSVSSLLGNYPNPFNPSTSIRYQVSSIRYQMVQISIYNIKGQLVRTLVKGYHQQGEYSVVWDGTDDEGNIVSSGIYFYRMVAGEYRDVRRMVLVK